MSQSPNFSLEATGISNHCLLLFVKIRHYGLLANRARQPRLQLTLALGRASARSGSASALAAHHNLVLSFKAQG